MLKYGHSFDETFIPTRSNMYNKIIAIYKDATLTKTSNTEYNSVYMGKTSCLLINECRYLIATVKKDNNIIGTKSKLSGLNWLNFQTRVLKGEYNCDVCNGADLSVTSESLQLHDRNEKYTQYICNEYDIKVSLLHTKKNNIYEYPNSGNLVGALETYNCVISFTN